MHKIPIDDYSRFQELPFKLFHEQRFGIYILDFEWNYLFVNSFACENLNLEAKDLIGNNMWQIFPAYKDDPIFAKMRKDVESGRAVDVITVSPVTHQRVNILSHKLGD